MDLWIMMPAQMAFGQHDDPGSATVRPERVAMAKQHGCPSVLACLHERVGYLISIVMVDDPPTCR